MLCEIICIVEMDKPLLMSLHYILRKQETACDILAHLTCHVVTLHAVYSRILVGVFLLYLLVIALKKAKNLLVCRIRLTDNGSLVSVSDVVSGYGKGTLVHELVLHHILYLLNAWRALHVLTCSLHVACNFLNLISSKLLIV